jgi:hypothetical protein
MIQYAHEFREKWRPWSTWQPAIVSDMPTAEEIAHIATQPDERWGAVLKDVIMGVPMAFDVQPNIRIVWIPINNVEPDVALVTQFARYAATASASASSKMAQQLVRIYYWDVDTPRQTPTQTHATIHPIHVNGGASYQCATHCINIYRREEAAKVLLHELVHAFCEDVDITSIAVQIGAMLGTGQQDLRLYEAYTEFLAEWRYISMTTTSATFEETWNRQLQYADKLVRKLLRHYGRRSIFDKTRKWKEATAVFSYYVMKTVLLHHADDVLKNGGDVSNWPGWLRKYGLDMQMHRKTRKRVYSTHAGQHKRFSLKMMGIN